MKSNFKFIAKGIGLFLYDLILFPYRAFIAFVLHCWEDDKETKQAFAKYEDERTSSLEKKLWKQIYK